MSALVDWRLAGRVAGLLAGDDPPSGRGREAELTGAVAASVAAVEEYTRLEPRSPLPAAEWVSRRQWVELNLASMRASLAAVEPELTGALGSGPAAAVSGATLGRLAAVQLGALVGYGSRRVLGQYEFPLLAPDAGAPRLLFVAANIAEAEAGFGAGPGSALRWIALHEVTHAVHFAATPWLADHLGGLARRLLRESRLELRPAELLGLGRDLLTTDPREMLRRLGAGDPLTLLTPPSSRELLASAQAAMAAIEGYAEHVMDAAAPLIGEDVAGLRTRMERRRSDRGPLARLLGWLLGIELKLRQYREGKAFADEVVGLAGIEALNRAWTEPALLPTAAELGRADAWVGRTSPLAAAA